MLATCQRGTSRLCAVGPVVRLAPEWGKKIDPVYYSKAYKIKLVLVVEFIFGAHNSLNVHH